MFKNKRFSDKELLTGLQVVGPQKHVWEERFFRQFQVLIWKRSRRFGLSDEEAGDAYTDAIIAFLKQLQQGKFRGESSIYTYLNRIFSNKCIDFSRKKTTRPLDNLQEELPDQADASQDFLQQILDKEKVKKLQLALSKLGETCRRLLLLVGKGYKTAEIAKEMDFSSPQSAASQKFQCKQKLLEHFTQAK